MSTFDRRHRWGPVVHDGARITRTCRACGRVDTAEILIRYDIIEALVRQLNQPNVYRQMIP